MIELAPAAGLLERATEIGALEAAIAAAGEGNGRFVVIEGEAGIGKSTLLARAVEMAREQSLRVLRTRATELELGISSRHQLRDTLADHSGAA